MSRDTCSALNTSLLRSKSSTNAFRLRIGTHHECVVTLKVCSHLTFASAFASTSPSKFNIASMETQTQTHRMGLNPLLTFYFDVDANANVRCEHTLTSSGSRISQTGAPIYYLAKFHRKLHEIEENWTGGTSKFVLCVVVHGCPPLSPSGLPSDGRQVHVDLVTGTMLLHHSHNTLQMAASWVAL